MKPCNILHEESQCLEHDSTEINNNWVGNTSGYCNVYVKKMHDELHKVMKQRDAITRPIGVPYEYDPKDDCKFCEEETNNE